MNKTIDNVFDVNAIIRFFEDCGYNNVEVIGDRLIFTTGEDVINYSLQESINFIKNS